MTSVFWKCSSDRAVGIPANFCETLSMCTKWERLVPQYLMMSRHYTLHPTKTSKETTMTETMMVGCGNTMFPCEPVHLSSSIHRQDWLCTWWCHVTESLHPEQTSKETVMTCHDTVHYTQQKHPKRLSWRKQRSKTNMEEPHCEDVMEVQHCEDVKSLHPLSFRKRLFQQSHQGIYCYQALPFVVCLHSPVSPDSCCDTLPYTAPLLAGKTSGPFPVPNTNVSHPWESLKTCC